MFKSKIMYRYVYSCSALKSVLINRPSLLVKIGVADDPGDFPGHLIGVTAPLVLTAQEDRDNCGVISNHKNKQHKNVKKRCHR